MQPMSHQPTHQRQRISTLLTNSDDSLRVALAEQVGKDTVLVLEAAIVSHGCVGNSGEAAGLDERRAK